MCDRVRYTSVPPGGTAAAPETMANPAYSSTNISAASETASVTTTEPIFERVEIELAPFTKRFLSEPKNLKLIILSLVGLVSILLLFNIILIFLWTSASSAQPVAAVNQQLELVNGTTVSTVIEILPTSATDILTTMLQLSTPDPAPNVSDETMNREYSYFTRRFNRPKSDDGLRKFADNYAIFTTNGEGMHVAETQFADLSLNELKKIVNPSRDSSRSKEKFGCEKIGSTALSEAKNLHDNTRIPARIDLRQNAKMPKVRNQGTSCTSGYAFAAIGLMDYFEGKSLSVQYVLCDKHNFHCQGGEAFKALQTAHATGFPEDHDLLYSETDKWCTITFNKTTGYANPCFVTAFDYTYEDKSYHVTADEFISLIISEVVPPIVEVPVDRSFFFYKGGIYRPKCDEIIGYQPVIVVGYHKRDGVDVWILRNSFGTDWGIEGDFEMEKGVKADSDDCDAFEYAIY